MEEKRSIWLRLGVTVEGTPAEIEALFSKQGNEALARLIKEGKFKAEAESYIPESCVIGYNMDYGTNHGEWDWDFDLYTTDDTD